DAVVHLLPGAEAQLLGRLQRVRFATDDDTDGTGGRRRGRWRRGRTRYGRLSGRQRLDLPRAQDLQRAVRLARLGRARVKARDLIVEGARLLQVSGID